MFRYFALRGCLIICLWIVSISAVNGDCRIPKGPHRGRIIYEKRGDERLKIVPDNYLLKFECFPGFTLIGRSAILCAAGSWSHHIPTCIEMRCQDPPDIQNGHFNLVKGRRGKVTLGSRAIYKCDEGYQLENDMASMLTCEFDHSASDLNWAGEVPRCKRKEPCLNPGLSKDGEREGNCCYVGDILKYSCKDGYTLVGNNTIECTSSKVWTSKRPRCRPLDEYCGFPPPIPYGVAIGEKTGDYFLPYDEVQVMCDPGYTYSKKSAFIMCEEGGIWEEEFAECVEAFCDPPGPLRNGTIPELSSTNITAFPYGFEITYICDYGFRLIGDSWRFCGQRRWTGKTPYCEPIVCPNPGVPEHGRMTGNSFKIGDKVLFTCNSGFTLLGSFQRFCMPNGQWSGQLTSCDAPGNYCPDPGIPINGMKNSSNYDMGSRIGFRCQPDFSLIGSEVRECLQNRTWSGTEAKCVGIYDFDNSATVKDILQAAVEEKVEEQRKKMREYRESVLIDCPANVSCLMSRRLDINFPGRLVLYFVFDVSGSVGKSNFKKSIDFAKALVRRVGISKNGARAGAVTFSSSAYIPFTPLDYNTTEDVLNALDGLNYTGGGTAASSALKLVREDLIPVAKMNLDGMNPNNQKSVIFILTDGKANMGGSPQLEAEELKKGGVEIYCIGITGSNMKISLDKIASNPKEEHVFLLKNYADFSDLIQEITNGSIDYSQCGLGHKMQTDRGRVVGGSQSTDYWPWMAAIYFFDSSKDVEPQLKCGGSIVSQNYILTAAHCLYKGKKGDWTLRNKEEIHVKLGLTIVSNQTNIQEFEVKEFHIHPDYTVEIRNIEQYDYDIALLHLKRPIEYKRNIRAVCLPPADLPPDNIFYKAEEWGVATGWGYDGVIEMNQEITVKAVNNLKEVHIPIQSRNRCMQSVVDKGLSRDIFTDRMFCAGDGRGNDTCVGDSGGPLMQSQMDIDGNTYWTQVGIVSWGIGCGLENTYGVYTHVHHLRSWIMEKLEAKDKN